MESGFFFILKIKLPIQEHSSFVACNSKGSVQLVKLEFEFISVLLVDFDKTGIITAEYAILKPTAM